MIGLTAGLTILVAIIAFRGQNHNNVPSIGWIVGIAALLRLMFLFRMPELSDDIYRYVLDGMMTLSGHNPYALHPAAVSAAFLEMARTAALVNQPQYVTLYPPAAQMVFAIGALFGGVIGMKIVLILFELGTCAIMVRLLDAMDRPRSLAILYAWHPLAVIETAGSGHIDAAGIFFLFAAIYVLTRYTDFSIFPVFSLQKARANNSQNYGKHIRHSPLGGQGGVTAAVTGVLTTTAVLIKLFPVLFLPGLFWRIQKNSRKWFTVGFLVTGMVLILPFLPELTNGIGTLSVYLRQWEFSGFLFRGLRGLTHDDQMNRLLLATFFLAAATVIYGRMLRDSRPIDRNDFLPVLFRSFYGIAFAWLLITPTLHPWYALYLAALLPFAGGPAGIVFTWTVFLGYRVQIPYSMTGQWIESDLVAIMIVAAPATAWAAGIIMGRFSPVYPS